MVSKAQSETAKVVAKEHHQLTLSRPLAPHRDLTATHRALDANLPEEERAGKATCFTTFTGHKDYVLSVSCSPNNQWIASGSKDTRIQFWDSRTGQPQLILMGHKNSVIAISLSPAGGLLASGSGDFNARIWSYERIPGA